MIGNTFHRYYSLLYRPMLNLRSLKKGQELQNYFVAAITILSGLCPLQQASASAIVTSIKGELFQKNSSNGEKYRVSEGAILEPKFGSTFSGPGKAQVYCVNDGKFFTLNTSQNLNEHCSMLPSIDKQMRSSDDNDAPTIFYPSATTQHFAGPVIWGSPTAGEFILTITKQTPKGYSQIFQSDRIAIRPKLKKYITYHYSIPDDVLKELESGGTFKFLIKNTRNGRTNEESAIPGGVLTLTRSSKQIKTEFPSTLSKVANPNLRAIAKALHLSSKGRYALAFQELENVKGKSLESEIAFTKASILRRSGLPFDYSAALYYQAIRASKNGPNASELTARSACLHLTEDPFSITEYWKKEIKKLQQEEKYHRYCR